MILNFDITIKMAKKTGAWKNFKKVERVFARLNKTASKSPLVRAATQAAIRKLNRM